MNTETNHNITIIIVNWNTKDLLTKCLGSIERQLEKGKDRVIVIDNGSSDGSVGMVEEDYTWVELIKLDSNYGFAMANNIALRTAKTDYVFLINSDIFAQPYTLSKMLDFMKQNPSVGLAGPLLRNFDGSVQKSWKRYPTISRLIIEAIGFGKFYNKGKSLNIKESCERVGEGIDVEVIAGAFWIVRKKAMEKVGLLDERFFFYGEDIDWCKRFREAGWRVVLYTGVCAYHLDGGSSKRAPVKFYIEQQKSRIVYWEKHHKKSLVILIMIMFFHNLFRIIFNSLKIIFASNLNWAEPKLKLLRSFKACKWLIKEMPHIINSKFDGLM